MAMTVMPESSAGLRPILSTRLRLITVDATFMKPNPTLASVDDHSVQKPTCLKTSAA